MRSSSMIPTSGRKLSSNSPADGHWKSNIKDSDSGNSIQGKKIDGLAGGVYQDQALKQSILLFSVPPKGRDE